LIDLEGYVGGLRYVYGEILRNWRTALQNTFAMLQLPEWTDDNLSPDPAVLAQWFRQSVVELLDLLANQPGRPGLLLFLDEADVLIGQSDYPTFASVLRSVAEDPRCRSRFAMVLASLEPTLSRVDRIDSGRNPFYVLLREVSLGLLEPEDIRTMIVSIGGQMEIRYTKDALDLLVATGGGHPFLTRQLCSQVIHGLERPGTVDSARVLQAVEDYLRRPRNYLAESLWGIDSGGPPAAEATLLRLLAVTQSQPEEALMPAKLSTAELRARQLALEHLRDQSLTRRSVAGWEASIPLYRRWIRRHILDLPGDATDGGNQ